MNGMELGEATRARLAAAIPARTVYLGAVPDGTLPARYIVVWTSEGGDEATRSCDVVNVQTPELRVTSVSRNPLPEQAWREATWGIVQAREALRNWRPEGSWRLRLVEPSMPPTRNDSLPVTTYQAVDQYRVRSYV